MSDAGKNEASQNRLSRTDEESLLQRTRLELLGGLNTSSTSDEQLWSTTQYTAGYHENRVQDTINGFHRTFPPRNDTRPSKWGPEKKLARMLELDADHALSQTRMANLASSSEKGNQKSAKISPSEQSEPWQARYMVDTFHAALSESNTSKVYRILEQCFEEVAIQEYSWLVELRKLGYSPREIGDELLEASHDGPWIFSKFEVPDSQPFLPGFHIDNCLHSNRNRNDQETEPSIQSLQPHIPLTFPLDIPGHVFRESIEYFCGIGGVSPLPTGVQETQFGSVKFKDNNSTAIVSCRDPYGTNANIRKILVHLQSAIGVLQSIGGCCDSFTFLSRRRDVLELHRIDLLLIRTFILDVEAQVSQDATSKGIQSMSEFIFQILAKAYHERPLSTSLLAQFLCLAFLSYSQAHCGSIRPFFLDTHLRHIILIGDNEWQDEFRGPCIIGSLTNLSCFGDMLQEPVFIFQYYPDGVITALSQSQLRFDLLAEPEDVLDTWGPGELVTSKDDVNNLHAISIGDGYIIPSPVEVDSTGCSKLHWSRASKISMLAATTFPRREKSVIGTRIVSRPHCNAQPKMQIQKASGLLNELGTFPDFWQVSERQMGLGIQGGGPATGLLQFNQTWIKRSGMTKKSKVLSQRSLYIPDLEAPFGIQISVCTGIARRVRLRDLLADILPIYVAALVTKPLHWESLATNFELITALRNHDMDTWLKGLDHTHQKTFEHLVFSVLFLLQDTGVDRAGQNFIVGCIQPGIPFQCFSIPCKQENYWTRIVADSEDVATFVYMTTECLETDAVKCRGPGSSWVNSTALLWIAVSCCDDGQLVGGSSAVIPAPWTLKHLESYLIGRADAPLFVQVDRPDNQEEPRLLVSLSRIRPDILNRLYRKGKYGKPRRLREKRMFDLIAESVVVLANPR